ncbi:patatin-like phospholipase domain-containing protein 4 [Bufo gargarizans]|uniref:patatin-like phospholipase domain-containing protein 4 n=1 Tax=Bufo gargarizans TaxID=30331 RepID=UPI001CF5CD7B|nr:patatin-like phospholipase domain-containing protein 4 [Bufo gargarizans]XP_044143277.1 patatin-like phospholipase domain-containing protein 4 [Bufo gargarizans]
MKHLNLSFSACGFLGIYHLGAASAFVKHGQKMLNDVNVFAGASAGSLAATVLLTAPHKIQESRNFLYTFSEDFRSRFPGVVKPRYDFMNCLREGIETILPAQAHEIAENRLCVSITNSKSIENCLVSSFASREELIKVLLASCYVPLYAGVNAVEYKGEKWFDGGFTNSLPVLPTGRTITVSPFCGRQDICPKDNGHFEWYFKIGKQQIKLSAANWERLREVLFPPSRAKFDLIFQDGFEDAVTFLQSEDWYQPT